MIAALVRVPTLLGAAAVELLMIFHGHAHGGEIPKGSSSLVYLLGFSLVTLTLTFSSRQLGHFLMNHEAWFGDDYPAAGALSAFG